MEPTARLTLQSLDLRLHFREVRALREYACNTDAVMEAARRAFRRAPDGVTAPDVQFEFAADAALGAHIQPKVPIVLSDLARTTLSSGTGSSVVRRQQAVRRLGRVGRLMYYWIDDTEQGGDGYEHVARRFMEARLCAQWDAAAYAAKVEALKDAISPVIAHARAARLAAELEDIETQLVRALGQQSGGSVAKDAKASDTGATPPDSSTLLANAIMGVRAVRGQVAGWLRFRATSDPVDAAESRVVSCPLTQRELVDLFAPFSTAAAGITDMREVRGYYGKQIRSVPNPERTKRTARGQTRIAAACFDGFEARCYLARQWGGALAQLLALRAQQEMGDLRNVRFPLQALEDPRPEVRRRVVACLGMLGEAAAEAALRERAFNDVDSGVRELALLALGIVAGDRANDTLRAVAAREEVPTVRQFAKRALQAGERWWWRF